MNYHSIQGAWKGVFWHKNHMGLMAGFACITFLASALGSLEGKSRWWWFWGALYVFSLLFVSQTDSVATYMSLIVVHIVMLVLMGHARLKARLHRHHYWVFAVILVLLLTAVYSNRDWVLALFNRNSSLTGRVPLWGHLLSNYVAQSPLGGYGLNAFWHLESHRIAMQLAAGYPDPIVVSDNGFLDLLLNIGFVGIALFFLFYFDLWRRAANMAWRATDVLSLFPLIAMVYILAANLTWSLLFENESFFMLTMITMSFLMARRERATG